MPPQVGVGGETPMPRKVRNDTASRAAAVIDAVVTTMFGSTLRSTWARMTCSLEAPSSSAASTYWARACSRVAARVTRKKIGASRIPTAIIACGQAVAERGGDRDGEEDVGQGHQRVADPVDHEVEPAAQEDGGDAGDRPEDQADADRLDGGEHGQAGPGHEPAQHVPAEIVGAEQVLGSGALEQGAGVDGQRVLRGQGGAEHGQDRDGEQDAERDLGRALPQH